MAKLLVHWKKHSHLEFLDSYYLWNLILIVFLIIGSKWISDQYEKWIYSKIG